VTQLLDFSRITSEQTSGPQTIIEDNDKSRTVQRDLEYQGNSPLETGATTLGNVLDRVNPVKLATKKDSPISQVERPRRGKYYLVGKRAKIVTSAARGRYVWHELPKQRPWDVAFGPTVRAAAPYQLSRHLQGLAIAIEPEDLRVKMREYPAPFSILLLVDMSLSMATSIANLGRAMLSFHRSVYRRRDRVGLIVFKGSEAVVLQHPTSNLNLVVQKLWKVGTSDFTPMAAGMLKAWKMLQIEKQRNKDAITMLIIVSDGITNIPLNRPLTKRRERTLLSVSQSDVFDVAQLLVRDDVRVIVINTAHRQEELHIRERQKKLPLRARWYLPTEFLMELANTANGSYYGLSLKQEEDLIKGTKLEEWFYIA
jgi:Mg-chelatase subunit ChlD